MVRKLHLPLRRLAGDHRGATLVEFAILIPAMVMMVMGLMDLSYQAYAQAVLEGAMQKAGRDSGIEAATTGAIDTKVSVAVKQVAKNATIEFKRKNYSTFGDVKAERFDDNNNNGTREVGECYDDVNGSDTWDNDAGRAGQGGASDVTMYTVTVTYPRLFPLTKILGWSSTETISASTLLKNQPYNSQTVITPEEICT